MGFRCIKPESVPYSSCPSSHIRCRGLATLLCKLIFRTTASSAYPRTEAIPTRDGVATFQGFLPEGPFLSEGPFESRIANRNRNPSSTALGAINRGQYAARQVVQQHAIPQEGTNQRRAP